MRGGGGDLLVFIKRFGMNTVKEKPEKRQEKNVGPWNKIPYVPHRALSLASLGVCTSGPMSVAQGVPVAGERLQRSSVLVQRKRPSVGLTLAEQPGGF